MHQRDKAGEIALFALLEFEPTDDHPVTAILRVDWGRDGRANAPLGEIGRCVARERVRITGLAKRHYYVQRRARRGAHGASTPIHATIAMSPAATDRASLRSAICRLNVQAEARYLMRGFEAKKERSCERPV